MSEMKPIDIRKHLALVWGKLLIENHHVAAVLTGVLGYVISRDKGHNDFESVSMVWIRKAVEELQNGSNHGQSLSEQTVCSFCGRGKLEVRLAAGAKAFICEDCVNTLAEAFSGRTEK